MHLSADFPATISQSSRTKVDEEDVALEGIKEDSSSIAMSGKTVFPDEIIPNNIHDIITLQNISLDIGNCWKTLSEFNAEFQAHQRIYSKSIKVRRQN